MNDVAEPTQFARAMRVLGVVLVFVLLGPPVGGFVFMMVTALVGMGRGADVAGLTWVALFAVIYAVPLSYLAGIVPAAIAGMLIGVRQAYFGPATWAYAVATGLAVGLGLLYVSGQRFLPGGGETTNDFAPVPVIVATCLAATMVCWLVVRGWHVARTLGQPA